MVLTPSGAVARIVRIYPSDEAEALVEWRNGETAKFRVTLLRPYGEP